MSELLELERRERLSAKTAQYFDHRLCFTDAQARTHQSFMEKKVNKALNNRQPTESMMFVKISPFDSCCLSLIQLVHSEPLKLHVQVVPFQGFLFIL